MLLPDPPLPIAATFVPLANVLAIDFDRDLVPGVLSPAQLWCRFLAVEYAQPLPGTILGNRVQATMGNPVARAGPNECSYAAVPPEIVSTQGIPAAPFAAFPVF